MFVSPVIDMESLIRKMLAWSNVTEEDLKRQKIIQTNFGETLDWNYYEYSKNNKITKWNFATNILYASKDNLTDLETINSFVNRYNCKLEVIENGEHWFHTPEQIEELNRWTLKHI